VTDLSLDDFSFGFTEGAHGLLDRYSQTHPGVGKTSVNSPFKTMKDVFIVAVYLGVSTGQRRPLDGKRAPSPFKGQVLDHDEQMYLRAIAIGATNDPKVIGDPQQVVRIAEEYANAGIWKLEEIATSTADGPLWDLLEHMREELSHSSAPQ
jgi:dnd system-associated protein 4